MLVGCIDIGTNSVRYLSAEILPGRKISIRERGLAAPRLGKNLDRAGRLDDNAIDRTVSELIRIKEKLDNDGVTSFRCVGTEALRTAANAEYFISRLSSATGLDVEIISGEDEARLIRDGVRADFDLQDKQAVIADIGGGSTEIIRGGDEDRTGLTSLPLGSVRLGALFFPEGTAQTYSTGEALKYCRTQLISRLGPSSRVKSRLIGLGGTFTTLAAIKLELEPYRGDIVHGTVLSAAEIETIYRRLSAMTLPQRGSIPGLPPDRADIIIPGIIIARSLLDFFQTDRITVSDRGLLYGLLFSFGK